MLSESLKIFELAGGISILREKSRLLTDFLEKRLIKEEKALAKQLKLEEKKRIKEEKKLVKQLELEEKKLIKDKKRYSKNKIKVDKKNELKKNIELNSNTSNTEIKSDKFSVLLQKVIQKNTFKPYPDINDIPN